MIYLWSDTHFNHRGILNHCPETRGMFSDVEQMNQALIERWNAVVGPTDFVYHLGDFGFSHSKLPPLQAVYDQLNGLKHLITGNHDEENKDVLKLGWLSVSKLLTLKHDGHRAELCHYPLESWKKAHKGTVMLHGHCHGSLKRVIPHRFDVGVDVHPDGPVSFNQYIEWSAAQAFEASDHHGDM